MSPFGPHFPQWGREVPSTNAIEPGRACLSQVRAECVPIRPQPRSARPARRRYSKRTSTRSKPSAFTRLVSIDAVLASARRVSSPFARAAASIFVWAATYASRS
jgi:hypothetical protein